MRANVIILTLSVLLGIAAPGSACVGLKNHAPKIPEFIQQNPRAATLVARDNYYSPRYLQVEGRAGAVISLENKGANTHGLIIPAFAYQGVVRPGEIRKVVVPKTRAGLYDFYCPFHKEMRGTIEILPSSA